MIQNNYPNDKTSRYLYRAGGFTAILFLIYSIVTILIFILIKEGYPQTALECYDMLKEDFFIGLLRLDIVSAVIIPFYYLLFFSLYHALKKDYELIAKIALFCILAGITIFISGLNIIELINLSNKYHAAASVEIKQQLVAAGEAILASDMWASTAAKFRGILIESGAVILSYIMLKTTVFSKINAWVGLVAHGFDLSSEVLSIFIPAIKDIFTTVAGPLYMVWFVMIALRLIKISYDNKKKQ
jgi:hypothetical protein